MRKSKSLFNRSFSLILALLMVFSLFPLTPSADAADNLLTFSWLGSSYTMVAGQSGSGNGIDWSCDGNGYFTINFTAGSGNFIVNSGNVKNASVTASVVENGKAKKVIVYKYKPKTGYHKKNGHRQQYTKVKIEKINA